jgi:hypothetical protein
MKTDRPQRGFISIGGIFTLLVLVAGVFLGIKLLPPYINNYQLQDTIQDLALNSSYNQVSEEELQKSVISKANGIGIGLLPKQVSVRKEAGSVVITVKYSVPIDLLVRQVELHFEPSTSNVNILRK